MHVYASYPPPTWYVDEQRSRASRSKAHKRSREPASYVFADYVPARQTIKLSRSRSRSPYRYASLAPSRRSAKLSASSFVFDDSAVVPEIDCQSWNAWQSKMGGRGMSRGQVSSAYKVVCKGGGEVNPYLATRRPLAVIANSAPIAVVRTFTV